MKIPKQAAATLHVLCHPVATTVVFLKKNKVIICSRKGNLVIGTVVMFTGGYLSSIVPHDCPHFVHVTLDTIAFAVHGFGAAPIVKVIAESIGIEV